MTKRMLPWIALVVVGGCAHETTPPPAIPTADYRLGVDDIVDVAVWKDPALSATVPVRPDGKVTLPMIGDVVAVGHTTKDLEREVAGKLKTIVSDPVVAVMVKEVRASRFFVLGEVAHPGAYPLTGALSVIQAMAVAGGPTEFAYDEMESWGRCGMSLRPEVAVLANGCNRTSLGQLKALRFVIATVVFTTGMHEAA